MPSRRKALLAAAVLPGAAAAAPAPAWPSAEEIGRRTEEVRRTEEIGRRTEEVRRTEAAFAAAFAARDVQAFRRFLAPDTIWVGQTPLHGPQAVMTAWQGWLTAPQPPFSWSPDLVLVLPSGELARTSGPVLDPGGKPIARFHSTWRRERAGGWQIVFDFGTSADG